MHAIIWANPPKALMTRLEAKPQQITEDCLMGNAAGILRLYENDVIQHVVRQQLRSDSMSHILRRQSTYQEGNGRKSSTAIINKLANSSFLGRDPSGQRPLPAEMWEDDELTEHGALLKDVQDTVWHYLRVHLPRILSKQNHPSQSTSTRRTLQGSA